MVNVNNVYQKVQAISNKEQRGYISPQEFNLLADKAQLDIINEYFDNIKMAYHKPTKNQTATSDEIDILNEKISYIKQQQSVDVSNLSSSAIITVNADCYKLGTIRFSTTNVSSVEVSEVSRKELTQMLLHPLTTPTLSRPVYVVRDAPTAGQLRIELHFSPTTELDTGSTLNIEYIARPNVNWGYAVVNNKALYASNSSTNFSLHPIEEVNLVNKILIMAGVMVQRPDVYQAASAERQVSNQEKNN